MKLDIPSKVAIGTAAVASIVALLQIAAPHIPQWSLLVAIASAVLIAGWSFISVWRGLHTNKAFSFSSVDVGPRNSLLSADADSVINAENAEIATSALKMFPNGFAKASDNSLIHMPGFRIVDNGDGTHTMTFGDPPK